MDHFLLKIFIGEVGRQTKFALMSVKRMDDYLRGGPHSMDIDDFWLHTQSFLVATANISKMLWNTERKAKEESMKLRQLFEVNQSSPIRSRRFRNLFEHYDEQLVDWAKKSPNRNYASSNVAPRGQIDIDSKDTFRTYYNDENVIIFRGEEYKIQPVVDELERLYAKHYKLSNEKHLN